VRTIPPLLFREVLLKALFWIAVLAVVIYAVASHSSDPSPNTAAATEQSYSSDAASTSDQTFDEDPCSIDCSGHQAGYDWAERNSIDDEDVCDRAADNSNSPSFGAGCKAYANGDSPDGDEDDDEN
jgi:hypothetical protein